MSLLYIMSGNRQERQERQENTREAPSLSPPQGEKPAAHVFSTQITVNCPQITFLSQKVTPFGVKKPRKLGNNLASPLEGERGGSQLVVKSS